MTLIARTGDTAYAEYEGPAGSFTNTRTRPAAGVACVTNNPIFVNAAAGDYRLRWGSPCVDAGLNGIMVDLAGQARPVDGNLDGSAQADIGAYERNPWSMDDDGDKLSDASEVLTHGTDPANADTDGDHMLDPDELYVGTSPTNFQSCLRILSVTGSPPARVSFPSMIARIYRLQKSGNPVSETWQPIPESGWTSGNGGILQLEDPTPTHPPRFYRVEVLFIP